MIASTWNPLLVIVAMTAGMFAQQAAHKFSAANEDQQVGSLVGMELFCSAEGYYLAGRFQPPSGESKTQESTPPPPESNDETALAAAEPPPASPSEPADPPAVPAMESEPPADDSMPSAPQFVSHEPAATESGPAPAVEGVPAADRFAEAAPAEPAAAMPEVTAPQSADEASPGVAAAEVLPPPTPEQEPRPGASEFGAFDDVPPYVAPPRTPSRAPLPPAIALPTDRPYYDVTPADAGRYVSPAELLRERAVARGEQRRQRIETRKWLGISPLRPTVAAIPYTRVEEPQQLILVAPRVSANVRP